MRARLSRLLTRLPVRHRDPALALVLAVVAESEVLATPLRPVAVSVPAALLLTLPLALRCRRPLATLVAVTASWPISALLGVHTYGYTVSVIPALVAIYTVGAYLPVRRSLAGWAFAYAAIAPTVARHNLGVGNWVWVAIVSGGAWLAGYAVRTLRLQTGALRRLTRALELEREENTRTAVARERSRIARELHDIVAHSVSVMVVQAGGAEQVLATDPASAAEPLASIQRTGRQTLVEMRRLLGVLRSDAAEPALAPQPGLLELEALTAKVQDSGLPVGVRVQGDRAGVSPGLDLAAYRIVQEALTNVLKHAGASHVNVAIRYGPSVLELEVSDNGRGGTVNGTGHGLVGMRERATIYGGELEARPRPEGGFLVRARLPLTPAP